MPSLFLRYLGKGQLQCWLSNRYQWISRAVPNTARPALFLKTMLEFALQWEKDKHKSKVEPEHKHQSNKTMQTAAVIPVSAIISQTPT